MHHGMKTEQIDCILGKTYHHDQIPAHFLGVYARDKIPLPLTKYPGCFVANTDRTGQPGEHWVAFYQKSRASPIEFFDSFGLSPEMYNFTLDSFVHNTVALQGTNSRVCGQYCILYLIHRPLHPSKESIIKWLASHGKSYAERDANIDMLVHHHKFYPPAPTCDPTDSHAQCCVSYEELNLFK